MMYEIGDIVKFYPSVITNQVFEGEIKEIRPETNQYNIVYEGSRYCVHEQFIIERVSINPYDINGWGIEDTIKIQKLIEENKELKRRCEMLSKYARMAQLMDIKKLEYGSCGCGSTGRMEH